MDSSDYLEYFGGIEKYESVRDIVKNKVYKDIECDHSETETKQNIKVCKLCGIVIEELSFE